MFLSYYYFEYYIFIIPALLLVLIAQGLVRSRFKHYGSVANSRGMSGAQAARYLLEESSVSNVGISLTNGKLTDNYNPSQRTIFLSPEIYNGTSVAAVGIALHEAGHAVQHANGYFPLRIRNAIVPVCSIGSQASIPLLILGAVLNSAVIVNIAILLFATVTVFQFITLPVEFNASHRALDTIRKSEMFCESDYEGAKKVLSAAALTYVAAFAQSVLSLLYYILRFTNRRD